MKKRHFQHEDDPTLKQSAHRGCAGSTLVGFLDPAGKSPEKPDLTSDTSLSRTLKWKPQEVLSNVDNFNILKN